MTIPGTHDHFLVALSVVIAAAASLTSLDLAGRVRESAGWGRSGWLAAAAVAMGGGIWAMHFVAMLAFSLPGLDARYDLGLTLLSLTLAVATTGGSFLVASRKGASLVAVCLSGLFMGLGIAAMHYVGMAAMRMHADLAHDASWVAVSLLIAVGAATTALWLAFRHVGQLSRLAAATVMGAAVSGMHYAAMRGTVFHAHAGPSGTGPDADLDQVRLALAVAAATFVILFLASVAAMFDRRFAGLAAREALALRRSEERARAIYRETPLPLHTLDDGGRIEGVSDAWLQLLGYREDEVIGRPLTDFMAEASARQRVREEWPLLARQGETRDAPHRFVTKAGAVLDVLSTSKARRDEAGTFTGAVGGLVDVTGQRRAEEALRQSQKMEAVGQLTGGVAHDFNNLLAVVLGNLEMLRKRVPDDARALRQLDGAVQAAERGAALTQRMLAFARRQDLRPEPVNVASLVHGMADLLARATGPTVRIDVHMPMHLPRVLVDANQLELALINLAVNARDAMPDGGTITFAAESDRVPDANGSLAAGEYVRLRVTDEGAGMDEATLGRAREPFFTTKGVGKGTGLGLSMVHGLAEQSGGRLELQSVLGCGTTATVWLPIAPAAPEARPGPATGRVGYGPARFGSLKILAVDDDALVRTNAAEMLEDLGHVVVQAGSGEEALRILRSGVAVDAVVTDHAMPGMTGIGLAAAVRAEWPETPIILASGYAELREVAGTGLPRLSKPFTQAALGTAVDDAVAAVRARGGVIPFPARMG